METILPLLPKNATCINEIVTVVNESNSSGSTIWELILSTVILQDTRIIFG